MDWQSVYFTVGISFFGYFLIVHRHFKDTERRREIEDARWKARNKREAAANLLIRNGYTFVKLNADIDGRLAQIFGKEATTIEGHNYYNFWLVEHLDGSFTVQFLGSKDTYRDRSEWECQLDILFDADLDRIEAFRHPKMSLRR